MRSPPFQRRAISGCRATGPGVMTATTGRRAPGRCPRRSGWGDGAYVWNPGYWGPQVGFYGGINYGYGYTGVGYQGGYWDHDRFFYNRSVNNVESVHVTNVYNRTVINNVTVNRVSYNGGAG